MAKRIVDLTKEGDQYVFKFRKTGKEILRTDCPHRAKDYALSIRRNSRNTIDVIRKIKEGLEPFTSSHEIPSFRDFFLTENVYIRDQDEWVMLYHEMWWDFIDRAHSEASEDVKRQIEDLKPGYIITGPTEQVNFYEINEPPSPHVVFQKKHLFEDQGPDRVFSIHDYTLEDVKDWWEEQMQHYGKYKAGTLNMEPPDPADMWKHQGEEPDANQLIQRLKSGIENEDSDLTVDDMRELYWDAVDAGADQEELDADLEHYVKIDYLHRDNVTKIRRRPGEPGDRN